MTRCTPRTGRISRKKKIRSEMYFNLRRRYVEEEKTHCLEKNVYNDE